MAITTGMLCLNCESQPARRDSHYCSDACRETFLREMRGPVSCEWCDAGCDTVAEAKRKRWKEIEEDAEGISANYTGVCPPCWKEHCT